MAVELIEGDRVTVCWPGGDETHTGVVEAVNPRRGQLIVRLDNGLTMRMMLEAFRGDDDEAAS